LKVSITTGTAQLQARSFLLKEKLHLLFSWEQCTAGFPIIFVKSQDPTGIMNTIVGDDISYLMACFAVFYSDLEV
jgi:hypothetical protein